MQAVMRSVSSAAAGGLRRAPATSARAATPSALSARATTANRASRELRLPTVRGIFASVKCSAAAEGDVAEVAEAEMLPTAAIDMRVGKILSAEPHPDADSLYVETIDVGEEEPRTIISGLAKYVELDSLKDRPVVVLCNLKPRNMRGIKSFGMLLCASDEAHENVEPLLPPADAPVGERVFFGEGGENQPDPETANKVQKKKLWEAVQPDLKTDGELTAGYKGATMLTSAGPVKTPTLANANIS